MKGFKLTTHVDMRADVAEQKLDEAMQLIDDYLNAGCKETRKAAHEKAKKLFCEYYGGPYKNRNERKSNKIKKGR